MLLCLSVLSYIVLDTLTTLYCVRIFGALGVNALDSELSPIIRVLGHDALAVVEAKLLVGTLCVAGLFILSRIDGLLESCSIIAIALTLMGLVAGANNILVAWGWPTVQIFGIPLPFIGLAMANMLEAYGIISIFIPRKKIDKTPD